MTAKLTPEEILPTLKKLARRGLGLTEASEHIGRHYEGVRRCLLEHAPALLERLKKNGAAKCTGRPIGPVRKKWQRLKPTCACGCGKRLSYETWQRGSRYAGPCRMKHRRGKSNVEIFGEEMAVAVNAKNKAGVAKFMESLTPKQHYQREQRIRKSMRASFTPERRRRMSEANKNRPPPSPETRALLRKASIKSIWTQTRPEAFLHRHLDKRSWKYTGAPKLRDGSKNPAYRTVTVPVSADIVRKSTRTIVQVDGCYWHGCPEHFPQRRTKKTRKRDARMTRIAERAGWTILRFWECKILGSIDEVLAEIKAS